MARYKRIETGLKLLPVDLAQQVVPGSFEHALCHLIDAGEVDLSGLEDASAQRRYRSARLPPRGALEGRALGLGYIRYYPYRCMRHFQ